MLQHSRKLLRIQQLRAIAAILVVHAHVLDLQLSLPRQAIQSRFFYLQDFGAFGVDLFFVISGFIITLVSSGYTGEWAAGRFFLKRMFRVIPLYWLLSLVFALIGLLRLRYLMIYGSLKASFFLFPFWQQGTVPAPKINAGWTLYFEILFYTIVSICMFFSRKHYLRLLVTVMGLLMLADVVFFAHHPMWLQLAGNRIMLEFLAGVGLALVYRDPLLARRYFPAIAAFLAVLLCLAMVVGGYGGISESSGTITGLLSFRRAIFWGLPAALLVLAAAIKDHRSPTITMQWLAAIGDASFSIYLTHLFFAHLLYGLWLNWINCPFPGDLQVLLSIVFAVTMGMLVYKWIEKPLVNRLNKVLAGWFDREQGVQQAT